MAHPSPKRDGKTAAREFRPARAPGKDEVACLEVRRGSEPGRLIPLSIGASSIGRAPSSDIELDEDGVSRHHAKIMIDDDARVTLMDLHSTNGTFLNRAQIERAVVRVGDEIQIGPDVTLRFTHRPEREVQRHASSPADAGPQLTPRELEVAQMAARGLTNAAIGKSLSISPRTVNSHLTKIYERLDVHSRAALAMFLAQRGLLPGAQ